LDAQFQPLEKMPSVTDGIHFWANASVLNLSSGEAVASWPDLSVNGYHLTCSDSAARPTFATNAIGAGGSAVRFAGNDWLAHGSGANAADLAKFKCLHDGSGATLFVLWKYNGSGLQWVVDTGGGSMSKIGFSYGTEARNRNPSENHSRWIYTGAGGSSYLQNQPQANTHQEGTWMLGVMRHAYENLGVGALDYDLDGADQIAVNAAGTPSSGVHYLPFTIGAKGSKDNFFLDGDVAEIIIYDRTLTDEEVNAVGGYLNEKYALDLPYDLKTYSAWMTGFAPSGTVDTSYSGDPDGDGINNLMEYAFGGNPLQTDTTELPGHSIANSGSLEWFYHTYNRRVDAVERNLRYSVFGGSSLGSLQTNIVEEIGLSPEESGIETVTNRIPLNTSGFIRVKVELVD